jgi:alkylation response protein AidB-like acyl-CoA dehydrogenase
VAARATGAASARQSRICLMTLRTAFTELFNVEHPIALAPMGGSSGGALAAAVSEAQVSAAKVLASDAARLVARRALQCHGAIGYTTEYDLYAKRAWAVIPGGGSPDWHRARLATARAAVAAAAFAQGDLGVLAPLAKRYCVDVFWHVAAEMIQLHGGIGFTWEHEAHRYLKRAKTSQLLLGSPGELRRLVAHRAGLY